MLDGKSNQSPKRKTKNRNNNNNFAIITQPFIRGRRVGRYRVWRGFVFRTFFLIFHLTFVLFGW